MMLDKAIFSLATQHDFPFILQALGYLGNLLLGLFDLADTHRPHELQFFTEHFSRPLREVVRAVPSWLRMGLTSPDTPLHCDGAGDVKENAQQFGKRQLAELGNL